MSASQSRGTNMHGGILLGTLPLRSIAVVGAGVSGWLAAATLRRVLGEDCAVTVASLPDDNAISGALAAAPSLHRLLGLLGADERALLRATRGTYRLGTLFSNWGAREQRYFQGFGSIGAKLGAVPFQHHWLRVARGGDCAAFEEFSMAAQLAKLDRFAPPHNDPRSVLSLFSYGWHFDAKLLADLLRAFALHLGVTERSGPLGEVELDTAGDIRAVRIGGEPLTADFFVDCSGTAAALSGPLGVAQEDWSAWLPCDRLQWTHSVAAESLRPFTEIEAQESGWSFSLPLQRYTVRGWVYSSEYTSDAEVAARLAPGSSTPPPHMRPLLRGRPREFWVRNCLLLPGEALEPLESAGLHLAQTGITRWLAHFPAQPDSPTDRGEYNRLTAEEYDRILDLMVLHYHVTLRDDSPFWRRCRAMEPPATLARRIALFTDSARLTIGEEEHCGVDGWLAVLFGQGIQPRSYDPLAEATPLAAARDALAKMAAEMRTRAREAPTQREFLARNGLLDTAGARGPA